ncbi:hypothetical protein DFAR_3850004 [Desulfarculales bacterium]
MNDNLKQKTATTAKLYFEGYTGKRPLDRWLAFDPGLATDLSLFITGQMYACEKVPPPPASSSP